MNRAMASNLNAGNGLGVTGLEANRCSGCNIESVAICLDSIKVKLRIGLDEMVM
jgi:predicted  nucleic acid-binding Zn-ribbon protein